MKQSHSTLTSNPSEIMHTNATDTHAVLSTVSIPTLDHLKANNSIQKVVSELQLRTLFPGPLQKPAILCYSVVWSRERLKISLTLIGLAVGMPRDTPLMIKMQARSQQNIPRVKLWPASIITRVHALNRTHTKLKAFSTGTHRWWREAVTGVVFSNDPISNLMNYATYWFIRFIIAIFNTYI